MRPRTGIAAFVTVIGVAGALAAGSGAQAGTADHPGDQGARLIPGDLLVSTSDYINDSNIVAGKTMLPPGSGSAGELAIADGDYPYVFNNDSVDGSFGVTPQLYLNEITPFGLPQGVIPVPSNELNTSFSSKSEGALNLSSDGKYVTFIDYVAAPDTVDASNANTPGVIDPTNPVPGAYYRAVASLSANGKWTFTETNAYSGNNGRAALMAKVNGKYYYYAAGNAGQPAADRRRSRRWHPDHHPVQPARVGAEPWRAHSGRLLQRHQAWRPGRQGRQGRQLPWPDPVQQRAVLHQG